MTGEQKPGGLEPYGWVYETFAPGAGWCAGPEWWTAKFTRTPPNPGSTRNVIALYTAPAEPAEARIRDAERAANDALDEKAAMAAEYVKTVERLTDRATAAEAKLARAVEGLERAGRVLDNAAVNNSLRILGAFEIVAQTLAALSQPGPASEGDGE